ncbi:MAG: DNA mismatch repair endonuclease MutL [Clostridia bacterium]|nr:DNA mismatch repair endonuclease MutL [Clostridia bacterium]
MGNIVLLDELTINKIAAGEVIERPASVVKELVENSIDAGADKITVEIQNGGIKRIKIIDNGCGISKDDMEFAFERHATSKIRQADDLENVKSMGFRGEALASIAAIANVKMISRTAEDESGNIIVVEGGKILENEEIAAGTGTTITVTNLFYNTPVRYKFLKKDFTEAGYIEDVVTRIALANPNISIKLINGNKTIIQTNGSGNINDVIYTIYGKDVAEGVINVSYNYEDVKVEGVVGKPQIARSNRSYQQFFVNKRYIKDKTLSSAADQAFKGLLTIGKYGFLILNIEVEPNKIDVNVHPTKLEIRWQEEQKIFKAVYHAIREGLLKEELVREPEKIEEVKEVSAQLSSENNETETVENIEGDKFKTQVIKTPSFINLFRKKEEQKEENFIENNPENTIQDLYNLKNGLDINPQENKQEDESNKSLEENISQEETENLSEDKPKEEFKVPTEEQMDKVITNILNLQKNMDNETDKSADFNSMYKKTFGKLPTEEIREVEENIPKADLSKVRNISVFESSQNYSSIPSYKFIGALFNTYIVIEIENEVYIIDQHAAHERVMYEKVKKNFYSETEKDSQIMLLPDIINLSHKEKNIVKENEELFKKAGFIFEEFGENTIRLIGVPSLCMELDTKELFIQLLDEIDTVAITATQEKEEKFMSTVACKAAVKAKMKLNKEEVDNLMSELLVLQNPFTCPHGRPTAIKMTKQELDHKFERT